MDNPQDIAERYIAAFNETDAARRRDLLDTLFTGDSTYTDPQVDLRGPAQIDGFIAQTQAHSPGFTFSLGGPVDAHHDQAAFSGTRVRPRTGAVRRLRCDRRRRWADPQRVRLHGRGARIVRDR